MTGYTTIIMWMSVAPVQDVVLSGNFSGVVFEGVMMEFLSYDKHSQFQEWRRRCRVKFEGRTSAKEQLGVRMGICCWKQFEECGKVK